MLLSRIFVSCLILIGGLTQAQGYRVLHCEDLWLMRLNILRNAGVCGLPPRGLSIFGRARCKYSSEGEAFITPDDKSYLVEIREAEKFMSCPRTEDN